MQRISAGQKAASTRALRAGTPSDCPECGQTRQTVELLRVHRLLAHPETASGGGTAKAARTSGS